MLTVLAVFTAGSVIGMVSFSHAINHLLKKYKNQTIASIKGFIIGSLGVVWPWKETLYKTTSSGTFLLDHNHNKIIENYYRFFPELNKQTFIAIAYIFLGLLVIFLLDWYGKKKQFTQQYGLVGKNISYSFSRTYFTNKFKQENTPQFLYTNFDIPKISDFKYLIKNTPLLKRIKHYHTVQGANTSFS